MQRWLCGRSVLSDEKRTLPGGCFSVKNAAFGKNFHEEAGDYELPEFELRRNFGYCPAQVQAEDEVSEEEIRDVLAEMGKFSPKDELNCGACGYNT